MEPFFYTSFLPKIKLIDKNNLNFKNFPDKSLVITNNSNDYELLLENNNCLKVYNTYPEKIINLNTNWKKLRLNWYIFSCN